MTIRYEIRGNGEYLWEIDGDGGVRTERIIESCAKIAAAVPLLDDLIGVLREIVGQKEPNRWGYDAAHVALNDDWRGRARDVLARVKP